MDKAGRIVVPAAIRERLGLVPGVIDISVDGSGLRIDAVAEDAVVEREGRLIVRASQDPASMAPAIRPSNAAIAGCGNTISPSSSCRARR